METISVSQFQTCCRSVIKRILASGQAVLLTEEGVVVARLSPPRAVARDRLRCFGCMAHTVIRIDSDLVTMLTEPTWESFLP